MRVLAEETETSAYSKTSLRIWGRKTAWPLEGSERWRALSRGLIGPSREAMVESVREGRAQSCSVEDSVEPASPRRSDRRLNDLNLRPNRLVSRRACSGKNKSQRTRRVRILFLIQTPTDMARTTRSADTPRPTTQPQKHPAANANAHPTNANPHPPNANANANSAPGKKRKRLSSDDGAAVPHAKQQRTEQDLRTAASLPVDAELAGKILDVLEMFVSASSGFILSFWTPVRSLRFLCARMVLRVNLYMKPCTDQLHHRIDTQGLLDRVFPLADSVSVFDSPSTSTSSSKSNSTPKSSQTYSLRSLLKESSQYPLSVLKVCVSFSPCSLNQ